METYEKLKQLTDTAYAVSFSYVGDLQLPRTDRFPYAVSIMYKLSDAVLNEVLTSPTYQYFSHYRMVNTQLDLLALRAVRMLEGDGFFAYPIAASQSVPKEGDKYTGTFPHKTAARRAGLGWIGKNGMLNNHKLGNRFRLSTVLTNCKLPESAEVEDGCGDCNLCVACCPAKALTGNPYIEGAERETVLDAKKCSDYMKEKFWDIGRGSVCGLCFCKRY